jgi:hypothetical protein
MTILNLNKARKAKAKTERLAQAARNRAFHGQTKGDKAKARADSAAIDQTLDGARRDRNDRA